MMMVQLIKSKTTWSHFNNVRYFRPSRSIFNKEALESIEWTSCTDDLLIKGVKEFGVSNWSEIILKYLPNWVGIQINNIY